ncbi:MAG: histidine triad nucleotide-binding protein [Opitutales bacterium]|nr:histidine triad nucleotide-binding protein [Opitutales bacterium]
MADEPTLFERIIQGEIPARLEHEDDTCVALHDVNPQAPVHILIVPRKPVPRVGEAADDDKETLGHLLLVARDLARRLKLGKGFRLVINNGSDGGESVPHLHVHLLAGRPLTWPPG